MAGKPCRPSEAPSATLSRRLRPSTGTRPFVAHSPELIHRVGHFALLRRDSLRVVRDVTLQRSCTVRTRVSFYECRAGEFACLKERSRN